ncbi:glycerol-3-phosphate 1-O-acyltransferase PlsY [Magnetococcales bacterium HHB-1]
MIFGEAPLTAGCWLLYGYVSGAIPFGLLLGYLWGSGDIRKQGSGNIGATNVLRIAGKKAGILALLLDIGKGATAVLLVQWQTGNDILAGFSGLAAFLGHLFPIFLRFKGGKGVATALGITLAWTPWAGLLGIITWLTSAVIFKISSLAALLCFAIVPMSLLFLPYGALSVGLSLIMSLMIFWRHRSNIHRLIQGTEPRIGQKKTPEKTP